MTPKGTTMFRNTTTAIRVGALAAVAALALAGCSATADASAPEETTAAAAADSVTLEDAWVKAADSGMSAAFGEIVNTGSTDVTVESASTPASSMLELHETVEDESGQMIMREIEGGFVIPAGGSLTLEPGADHIMIMGLTAPLAAGDETEFALTFNDGSELEFTAPVKDYEGANEVYDDGEMDMGH